MARTRSQTAPGASTQETDKDSDPVPSEKPTLRKRKRSSKDNAPRTSLKKAKSRDSSIAPADTKVLGIQHSRKVQNVLSVYGALPLHDVGLSDPAKPTAEIILALVFHAMLTSARISHDLAYKSVKCLIEAGYQNLDTLSKSTWQERTEVLTKGGYTHYREKTATGLGELAEFVRDEYDSDLNNLYKRAKDRSEVQGSLKKIKGLGNVGVDIFCNTAQHIWSSLAPFVDARSLETAKQIGIGNDAETLWEQVGKDAIDMCRLCSALTKIRLEKRQKEFS